MVELFDLFGESEGGDSNGVAWRLRTLGVGSTTAAAAAAAAARGTWRISRNG